MEKVTIVSESGKGRSFSGTLLASIEADRFWPNGAGGGEAKRPVWAVLGASTGESRAFIANVRMGKLLRTNEKSRYGSYEFLRSAGYEFITQKFVNSVATTVYLPELFLHDPGMVDPEGVKFVLPVPKFWLEERTRTLDPATIEDAITHVRKLRLPNLPENDELRMLVPCASLFCSFLDRRTRCPLIPDLRFQFQALVVCLHHKIATFPGKDKGWYRDEGWGMSDKCTASGLADAGISRVFAMNTKHEDIEAILSECASKYFALTR